jgi:hypothetical protein
MDGETGIVAGGMDDIVKEEMSGFDRKHWGLMTVDGGN